MDWRKLIINAVLAGFWAGVATLAASGEVTKAGIYAAAAVAIRVAIGYVTDRLGATVPVDK